MGESAPIARPVAAADGELAPGQATLNAEVPMKTGSETTQCAPSNVAAKSGIRDVSSDNRIVSSQVPAS